MRLAGWGAPGICQSLLPTLPALGLQTEPLAFLRVLRIRTQVLMLVSQELTNCVISPTQALLHPPLSCVPGVWALGTHRPLRSHPASPFTHSEHHLPWVPLSSDLGPKLSPLVPNFQKGSLGELLPLPSCSLMRKGKDLSIVCAQGAKACGMCPHNPWFHPKGQGSPPTLQEMNRIAIRERVPLGFGFRFCCWGKNQAFLGRARADEAACACQPTHIPSLCAAC